MDKSWVYLCDSETKEQSREWLQHFEDCPQKPRQTIGTGKVMAVTFFDSQGLVYVEYMCHPQTVNQRTYQAILARFHQAWIQKRPTAVVQGRHFLHMDNASSHTATDTQTLLAQLGITQIPPGLGFQ